MGTRDEPCIQFHDECSCQIILETKVCHSRFAAGPVCVNEDDLVTVAGVNGYGVGR